MRTLIRTVSLLAVIGAAVMSGGCSYYSTPVVPPKGLIYTHVKHPITADYNGNPTGSAVKSHRSKKIIYIHDWLLTGFSAGLDDAKVSSIAREGGISEVSYAEVEVTEILGFYAEFDVTVYGN